MSCYCYGFWVVWRCSAGAGARRPHRSEVSLERLFEEELGLRCQPARPGGARSGAFCGLQKHLVACSEGSPEEVLLSIRGRPLEQICCGFARIVLAQIRLHLARLEARGFEV